MPRLKNETSTLVADVRDRLQILVEIARQEGHDAALAGLRSLVAGGSATTGPARSPSVRRGPGRPKGSKNKPKTTKSGKPRKNPWKSMTAEQRAERVRKMLAGRGLKPKVER